jgi:CO/xanthine dehydrogenase Mo-binding subunit
MAEAATALSSQDLPCPVSLKSHPRLSSWLRFTADGRVGVFTGKVELGQGILHALQLIAAQALVVDTQHLDMLTTTTAHSPDEGMTSGSLSVQDSGAAIRHACIHARALLMQTGATSYADLPGLIDMNQPVNWALSLSLSALPIDTAKDVGREDLRRLIHGHADFIHDLQPEGLLHGRMLRPRELRAQLDEAVWAQVAAQFAARQVGPDAAWPASLQLVRDGQLIGVIAPTEAWAQAAAQVLHRDLKWQAQPHGLGMSAQGTAGIDQPAETQVFFESGAADEPGISDEHFSADYFRPYLHHASMGSSCALALWTLEGLKVWSHSQGVFALRRDLALALSLPPDQVEVAHVRGAGCYGHNGADDVAFDAAWLARRCPGKTLRMLWSRADEMVWSPLLPAMRMRVSAQLNTYNELTDWCHEVWSQGHSSRPGRAATPALLGSWQTAQPFPVLEPINVAAAAGAGAERNAVPPYRSVHVKVVAHRLMGLPLRSSAMRALGAHGNVFAAESFMDEIAHARGLDPLAFRLGLLDDPRAQAVLSRLAEKINWSARRSELAAQEGRGLGLAFARYKGKGAYCAVAAEVEVTDQVRVRRLTVVADIGQVVHTNGAVSQLEGGSIQSTSWALKEAARWDTEKILTQDWEAYPILRFSEVPAVDVHLMPGAANPSLGAGEATQGPTTAAIANALFHALGVRVRELPLTAEAIQRAMD